MINARKFPDALFPKAAVSYRVGRHLLVRRGSENMRIPDNLLNTSVYLYPDLKRAEEGGRAGGTGFLFGHTVAGGDFFTLWVVTNRHVVENGAWTVRLNRKGGGLEFIDTDETEWFLNEEHDLAVRPIALSQDVHDFNCFDTNWILQRDWAEALDIGPGDPCITIGRFVGHDGKLRNTPTARFGQISQMNAEPIKHDGQEQDSFLVEIRSIGGYSGSPVLVHLDPMYQRPSIDSALAPDGSTLSQRIYPKGPWLLGISWCMIPSWEPVCDKTGKALESGMQVPANTGMMGVIPAWHLHDMLETGVASQRRIEIENGIASMEGIDLSTGIPTGEAD